MSTFVTPNGIHVELHIEEEDGNWKDATQLETDFLRKVSYDDHIIPVDDTLSDLPNHVYKVALVDRENKIRDLPSSFEEQRANLQERLDKFIARSRPMDLYNYGFLLDMISKKSKMYVFHHTLWISS